MRTAKAVTSRLVPLESACTWMETEGTCRIFSHCTPSPMTSVHAWPRDDEEEDAPIALTLSNPMALAPTLPYANKVPGR